MIKVFAFIVKRADLTDEQFHAHWREPHGRLTKKVPQIRRYLQNHGIGATVTLPGFSTTPYRGIATIWVESLKDLGDIFDDPGFQEVHEDELNLLDRDQLAWLITNESVILPGDDADDIEARATKAMLFVRRLSKSSDEEFQSVMMAVAESNRSHKALRRVTCALPVPEAYEGEDEAMFDGVLELSFPDHEMFETAWPDLKNKTMSELGKVADFSASRGFLAREERVIWAPFSRT